MNENYKTNCMSSQNYYVIIDNLIIIFMTIES